MNKFPFEVLTRIGSFIDKQDQITCSKVCTIWHAIFRPLVFQQVCLNNGKQVALYLKEDPSLRRMTTCLDFYTDDITEQKFEEIAKTTPLVESFTLNYVELETLSVPKLASIIQQYWSAHLIKVDLENDLLKEVLPLLKHQLQEVTGYFECFFDEFEELIPMPQLIGLEITCNYKGEFSSDEMTIKQLYDVRIAYPLLKSLKISQLHLRALEDDDNEYVYTPFPCVRALCLYWCMDDSDCLSQWKNMFTGLKTFDFTSVLGSVGAVDPYYEFFTENTDIVELSIDHYGEMAQQEGFPALQKLKHLTKLTIQGSQITALHTRRELLDFGLLISSIPNLSWLEIDRVFHITTGEFLDSYLSGTVGYNDAASSITYQHHENDDSIDAAIERENLVNDETLYKSNSPIIAVKKKMPQFKQSNSTATIYTWHEKKPSHHILDSPIVDTTYPLTTLCLKKVTLRNPAYRWIAQHLSLLRNFCVGESEPYPFCEITLGENIKKFSINFDERYKKFGIPIIRLIDDNSKKEKTVAWISQRRVFETTQPLEEIGLSTYAITIKYKSMPSYFTVCDHDALSVLRDIKNE